MREIKPGETLPRILSFNVSLLIQNACLFPVVRNDEVKDTHPKGVRRHTMEVALGSYSFSGQSWGKTWYLFMSEIHQIG